MSAPDTWSVDFTTGQPVVVVSDMPPYDVTDVESPVNIHGDRLAKLCDEELVEPDSDVVWPCTRDADHPGRHVTTGGRGVVLAAWPGEHLPMVEDLA